MLRDKNLVPLSHQHQHALALCVRLDRTLQAGEVDLEAWQAEIQQIFQHEISVHFAAEEKQLFPVAQKFPDTRELVKQLLAEHAALRELFASAGLRQMQRAELADFVEKLSHHIRTEERQLFENLQQLMSPKELLIVGKALDEALQAGPRTCAMRRPFASSQDSEK